MAIIFSNLNNSFLFVEEVYLQDGVLIHADDGLDSGDLDIWVKIVTFIEFICTYKSS